MVTPATAQKLALDGDLDYAVAPDTSTLSVTGEALTVELWIKHDGNSDPDAMILDKRVNNNGYELQFVGSGEEVPIKFKFEGGSVTSNSGIPADRWTHVAVTIDYGSSENIYINGELDAQENIGRTLSDNGSGLYFGTTQSANERFFSGKIDEVRIWNSTRSVLEIKNNRFVSLSGTETGLVGYYPFDATAPTADQSGNATDLTFNGGAQADIPDVFPVPPDLYVENEGSGQVSLRWEERPGPNGKNKADQFKLYRSPATGFNNRDFVKTFDSSATSHVATGLTNGETYFWEVVSTDTSAGTRSDYSSFVTGTPHNGSESEPLRGGASLKLDGQLDYGTVNGDWPSLNISGNTVTVETWIKHDGTSDKDAMILDKRANNNGYELQLVGSGEEVPIRFNFEGPSVTSNSGIPADRWTHVAVTYDGSTANLYINGELDAQADDDRTLKNSRTSLYLGTTQNANERFFSGRIDEVRIWDVVRSQAQIQSNYKTELVGNETGLLSYWRFNDARKEIQTDRTTGYTAGHDDLLLKGDAALEGPGVFPLPPRAYAEAGDATVDVTWKARKSGEPDQYQVYRGMAPDSGYTPSGRTSLTTVDASTTSYTDDQVSNNTNYFYEATALNGQGQESDFATPAPVTPSVDPFGNDLTLDGDQDYGIVGDRPSLSPTGNAKITVEARIKHDGNSDPDAMILDKRTGNNGYALQFVGSGEEVPIRFHVEGPSITSDTSIAAGEWTHVAATYDGSTLSLYINGELDSQENFTRNFNDNSKGLYLGTTETANERFYSGRIDDVRIWNRARTQSQIQSDYDQELTGNESGLVGYWRFGEKEGTPLSRSASGGRPKTVALKGDASIFSDPPAISVSPSALDVGEVPDDTSRTDTLTIANPGGDTLDVDLSLKGGSVFSIEGSTSFNLTSGAEREVPVTFQPSAVQTFVDTVDVGHNADTTDSPVSVSLQGVGISPQLAGTVWYPATANESFQVEGRALGGVTVRAATTEDTMTTTTAGDGSYAFMDIPNDEYTLSVMVEGDSGYVETGDAFRTIQGFVGTAPFVNGFQSAIADVDGDGVDANDALQIQRFWLGRRTSFPVGSWRSATQTVSLTETAAKDVNLWAAQVGDARLDGSSGHSSSTNAAPLIAAAGNKATAKSADENETRAVEEGESFAVPVRVDQGATLGAYGLALEYPGEMVSFEGASGPRGTLEAQASDGTVRLSWFDQSGGENPIDAAAGSRIVTLSFRAAADLDGSEDFELEVAEGELADGQGQPIADATLTVPKVTLGTPAPDEFALKGNAPNPFRGRTQIRVDLPTDAEVNVAIYNVLGQRVMTVDRTMEAGSSRPIPIDASGLASGTFFYRITAEVDGKTVKETGQMVQVR